MITMDNISPYIHVLYLINICALEMYIINMTLSIQLNNIIKYKYILMKYKYKRILTLIVSRYKSQILLKLC